MGTRVNVLQPNLLFVSVSACIDIDIGMDERTERLKFLL